MGFKKTVGEVIYRSKCNEYVVSFCESEGLDSIRFKIAQIDRPNCRDDEDIIKQYILDNYGEKRYEIITIDLIENITL